MLSFANAKRSPTAPGWYFAFATETFATPKVLVANATGSFAAPKVQIANATNSFAAPKVLVANAMIYSANAMASTTTTMLSIAGITFCTMVDKLRNRHY